MELALGLLTHRVAWPAAATWVLAGLGAVIVVLGLLVVSIMVRRRAP